MFPVTRWGERWDIARIEGARLGNVTSGRPKTRGGGKEKKGKEKSDTLFLIQATFVRKTRRCREVDVDDGESH